jgi:hypothetical protein
MTRAPKTLSLLVGLALIAALGAGCPFDPKIPSARVICSKASDCPSGYTCESINSADNPGLSVCCKDKGCAAALPDAAVTQIENAVKDAAVDVPAEGGAAPTCGNGRLDPGETCDPISNCPTSCPQVGCETYELHGSAAGCNAICVLKGTETACTSGDACCPSGCAAPQDSDCSCTCGNGMVEAACGEVCDPLSTCPSACAPVGCMLRRVANPGTCMATCVSDHLQTTCMSGDGCCPPGCNATNDSDCVAACGNGVLEAGESCDPPGSCPTTCPAIGCTKRKLTGTAADCTAHCIDDGAQTVCASGDGCCPSGCTTATDADCSCTCGNGQIEAACQETCDPLSSCPAACPAMGCQKRRLVNGGTCQAQCVDDVVQTACTSGDGCCPAACNANVDSDCTAHCGNGAIEAGETCDPPSSCPATCPWNACMRRKLVGSAAACTASCMDDGVQTACANGDGCCPAGCNSSNDNDCKPRCGDGIVDSGETCDGNCPATCPAIGCQTRHLQGTATACNAVCVNDTVITACTNGDSCCASGCTTTNDNDCACQCGNGVTEPACNESCDGANCPTTCPAMGCQQRALQGTATACTAKCVNTTVTTTCKNGDGCCPSACNANNDNDCTAVCGNSVIEAGEKCDPPSACQTQSDACTSDNNTIKTRSGTVASCTFVCTVTSRSCSATSDGFCPSTCTPCVATCGATQDIDCKYGNGTPCSNGNQCSTGNCVDGVCCNTACGGACDSCASGTCTVVGAGTAGSPGCDPYLCNGSSAGCPTSCSNNAACSYGNSCQAGKCACQPSCPTTCTSSNSPNGCGGTCFQNCSGCCMNDTCVLPPMSCF